MFADQNGPMGGEAYRNSTMRGVRGIPHWIRFRLKGRSRLDAQNSMKPADVSDGDGMARFQDGPIADAPLSHGENFASGSGGGASQGSGSGPGQPGPMPGVAWASV